MLLKTFQHVGLVLFGCLVALLGGEIAIRLLGKDPGIARISKGRYILSADPEIGYEPRFVEVPSDSLRTYDYPAEQSNSLGFRDRDHPRNKPPGRFRILLLGDSVSMGLWIRDAKDIYARRVEQLLREHSVPTDVINMAVVGYNSRQEVALLARDGLKYAPDLIIVGYCLNDRERNDGSLLRQLLDQELAKNGISAARVHGLLLQSALYRFVRQAYLSEEASERKAVSEAHYRSLSEDSVDTALTRLGRLAEQHGIPTLLVIFPEFSDLESYQFHDEHRRVTAIASKAGISVLDLLPVMRNCAQNSKQPVAFDRYHPNVEGNRCAAEAIASTILQLPATQQFKDR